MSSSPIPAGLGQLAGSDPARSDELHDLLDRLRRLPDPRRLRGRRHPLSYVLALAACGVLAGAKSLTAIEGPDSGPSLDQRSAPATAASFATATLLDQTRRTTERHSARYQCAV
ncbi:transposase family protein [Streptomyces canus]|uniref:transposase family protein n=1 Tax=Streptomyces canus TaxID=58343 RepID=UPI0027D78653|nr:transposase family protein [Streptomyces canus]